jgi:16S rRNA (cytidine1402-2'-O)-methyltransferase
LKKNSRKSIKEVHPEKKQSELVLFLNKRTEVKEHQDFIKPLLEGKILV